MACAGEPSSSRVTELCGLGNVTFAQPLELEETEPMPIFPESNGQSENLPVGPEGREVPADRDPLEDDLPSRKSFDSWTNYDRKEKLAQPNRWFNEEFACYRNAFLTDVQKNPDGFQELVCQKRQRWAQGFPSWLPRWAQRVANGVSPCSERSEKFSFSSRFSFGSWGSQLLAPSAARTGV
ncbi:unnamed protein product [Durusdinium trenchii]|uniref:Uncharacterized protein n=2 Tax=Durusdinium trenchii TaxID=1381693 RepID=A0ABP0PXJ9_9DINO